MTYIASRSISRQASVCGTGEDDSVQGVISPGGTTERGDQKCGQPCFRTNGSMIRRTVVGVPLYSHPCTAV